VVAILLTLLESEGVRIYNTFVFATAGDEKKDRTRPGQVHSPFRAQSSYERLKFRKRYQAPGESSEKWMMDLRGLVKTCNYGTLATSILRDQLVIGVTGAGT